MSQRVFFDLKGSRFIFAVKQAIFRVMILFPVVTRLYYGFVSARFLSEQQAVAAGIKQHLADELKQTLRFRLRRNIHRIEKGLSMRNRRQVFGLDYIVKTVDDYCLSVSSNASSSFSADEVHWYSSVLDCYFDACLSDDKRFMQSRKAFFGSRQGATNSKRSIPYRARDRPDVPFGIADFEALARRRRSVRWYLPGEVPSELVERAARVAGQSPSACNRQSVRIVSFCDTTSSQRIASLAPGAAGLYDNFPAVSVLVGDLSAYAHERDRHAIYVDGGLKAMTFMYALEAMGLSTCVLNWPDNTALHQSAAQQLGLQRHERVVMMIAIGFADPDGLIPFSYKDHR